MPRRILSLLFFILILSASTQAQTTAPSPSNENINENISVVNAQPAAKTDEIVAPAPEMKIDSAFKIPRSIVNSNLTVRVGIDSSQTTPLTLNEAVRRALENNNDIEVAREDVRLNETRLRSLEGIYEPVFTVSPTYTRNSNFRSSTGGATNDFSVNTGVLKQFEVGGGTLTPFFNNTRSGSFFSNGTTGTTGTTTTSNVTGSSIYNSTLGVTYNQPLLRNREIDNTRRQIRIQRKRLEQSDADFRRRTIDTIANVQRAYWDLVFALRDQQNKAENLNLTKENMRRVEAQIEAGAAAPLARAEVATELANRESEVLTAAENVTRTENTLKGLLLRDPNSPEWNAQFVPVDEPAFDQTPVALGDALAEARQNRPELQRLRLDREVNDIDLQFFRNQVKPRIDLNSSFSLNGYTQSGSNITNGTFPLVSTDPNIVRLNSDAFLLDQLNATRRALGLSNITDIPQITVNSSSGSSTGGFGNSLVNLFRSNSPAFSVGVTFEFPLNNKTAKADLAGAQIQRTQLDANTRQQEQIVITEVRNAVQAVETARQRIRSATTARENAEIQLKGEQKLFEVGRSTTFLLFQRENTLANARNAEIRAQTDYNKALADLQRATSTTLRANNVFVESLVNQ